MALWVVSDLHLAGAPVLPMFHEERQGAAIAELCARVAAEPDGELVLLGDAFDLTAMTPPDRGLSRFGRTVGAPLADGGSPSPIEHCAATRERHGRTLQAIADLAAKRRVTVVPGNHDHALGSEQGRAALDAAGLERVHLEPRVVRTIADRTVVLLHGHELDPDNDEPVKSGETLTRVLHHAIVPMVSTVSRRSNVRVDPARLIALRPEERMVPVLQRWLSPREFERFVSALLDLMVDLGALSRIEAWLATPERVREKLDDADDLWERTGAAARELLRGDKKLPRGQGRELRPDVLVLGHTHVPDWAVDAGEDDHAPERLYANLGSWTDRATDAVGPFDDTLPMLRIAADARGLAATMEELTERRVLESYASWRSAVPPGVP